jgi:hypothetical protein
VAKLLRERFEDADDGQAYLAKPLHKGPESATAIRKEVVFPEPDPPAGANSWVDPLPEIYQFVYAKGRYEGVSYLGVPSCRLTRQGGSWSYHAFNQALDAGITRPDGTQNHKLALQMEKDLTEHFGTHLMFIVTFKEDPTFHFNHDHIQVKPDRSGQTPLAPNESPHSGSRSRGGVVSGKLGSRVHAKHGSARWSGVGREQSHVEGIPVPPRLTPCRYAPLRSAPARIVSKKTAPGRCASLRSPWRLVCWKSAP